MTNERIGFLKTLKEIQCETCFKWYDKKYIKDKICSLCTRELQRLPKEIPPTKKIEYLKNIKLNNKKNQYSGLSKHDRAAFVLCSHCEWLREIDYLNLKIYCSMPHCQKQFEEGNENG